MNHFMAMVRPGWQSKIAPTTWEDVTLYSSFFRTLYEAYPERSCRTLDRFLMMFGKHYVRR